MGKLTQHDKLEARLQARRAGKLRIDNPKHYRDPKTGKWSQRPVRLSSQLPIIKGIAVLFALGLVAAIGVFFAIWLEG